MFLVLLCFKTIVKILIVRGLDLIFLKVMFKMVM